MSEETTKELSFVHHLAELRSRIIKSFIYVFIFFVISYTFADHIYSFLVQPYAYAVKNDDVKKHIQPKSLFFTRPTGGHYFTTKQLLNEAADKLFEQLKYGKVKIEIFKKYRLQEVVQAHTDLESRKIIGPSIIIP